MSEEITQQDLSVIGRVAHWAKTRREGFIPYEDWEIRTTRETIEDVIVESKFWHTLGGFEEFHDKTLDVSFAVFEDASIEKGEQRKDILVVDLDEYRAIVDLN